MTDKILTVLGSSLFTFLFMFSAVALGLMYTLTKTLFGGFYKTDDTDDNIIDVEAEHVWFEK